MEREPPLTQRELRMLRDMMAELTYDAKRAHAWAGVWGRLVKVLGALAALAVVADAVKGLVGG